MILLKMLGHDLHRSREENKIPLMVETPATLELLPAIVSSSRGEFLVSRKLKDGVYVLSGVFEWDSDRIDDIVGKLCSAALELSKSEGWDNVMAGKSVRPGFDHIVEESDMVGQPHMCLIPASWDGDRVCRAFGVKNLDVQFRKYMKYCHIVPCKSEFPVFLSRPDTIGMYTQFLGGKSSILLYNIRRGMAFCPDV